MGEMIDTSSARTSLTVILVRATDSAKKGLRFEHDAAVPAALMSTDLGQIGLG